MPGNSLQNSGRYWRFEEKQQLPDSRSKNPPLAVSMMLNFLLFKKSFSDVNYVSGLNLKTIHLSAPNQKVEKEKVKSSKSPRFNLLMKKFPQFTK